MRDATAADLGEVRRLAALVGQDHEWAGGDEHYLAHLLAHGRLVVADGEGALLGYAATRRLETREGTVSMLADLFVAPDSRGRGVGRALLSELWGDRAPRMTFSSTHPGALPLYTGLGLSAWWPLLYLVGDPAGLRMPDGCTVQTTGVDQAARLERRWTGVVRDADYVAWLARPDGAALVVRRDGQPIAVGAAGGAEPTLEHLRLAPGLDDHTASAAVRAALAGSWEEGRVRAYLPAPHPAVPALLDAGWRVEEYDVFMATHGGLLDPTRDVPSPALG